MRAIFSGLILLVACFCARAGDPKYPISAIPETLLQNNYAVVREEIIENTISAVDRSSFRLRRVVTILNRNGSRLTSQVVHYDKLTRITSIKATLYDASGEVIRRIKNSEIYDHGEYDNYTLFSDNRYKRIDLSHTNYPYTFEFEYEIERKFLYELVDYVLYEDDEVGIQKSTYSLIYPPDLKPRYKILGGLHEPVKLTEGSMEKLVWTFENIKPQRFQRSFNKFEDIPKILAGPSKFSYEGYTGKMDTWGELGKWEAQLLEGRDELTEVTKAKVLELTRGKSDFEKIRTLYKYLQSKTRYVYIEMGIGGLQPLPAKLVDEAGYGDCKALSNYMVALLKIAGIKGYFTTVMAGEKARSVVVDFPSHQGNHVIVSVPLGKDTVWLECTSQIVPFNYLGTFTQDRYALMTTETGGKLVRTPSYNKEENLMARKAVLNLQPDGKASVQIVTNYYGTRYDDEHVGAYCNLSEDDKRKWIQKNTEIPAYDIRSFSFKDLHESEHKVVVSMELDLPNAATINGKRLFLIPNLMNRWKDLPEKLEKRTSPISIHFPFTDVDTVEYNVPENLYPEFLPEPVNITSRFGEYKASYKISQGKLFYIRRFALEHGDFPPAAYNELSDFLKAVNRADNTKIVFLNKT
jgi:hypothetical protein